jgi:hypothetical protein
MIKAALEARKAGRELQIPPETESEEDLLTPEEKRTAEELVIDPELLQSFMQDIKAAQKRYISVVKDKSLTSDQKDAELKRATSTICTHLKQIREFNDGLLPAGSLQQDWVSWQCESKL